MKSNRVDDAINHYIKALKIKPQDAQSHYNLGIAYGQIGNKALAIKHFNQAEAIASDLHLPKFIKNTSHK